jgi:hypothetical protein
MRSRVKCGVNPLSDSTDSKSTIAAAAWIVTTECLQHLTDSENLNQMERVEACPGITALHCKH